LWKLRTVLDSNVSRHQGGVLVVEPVWLSLNTNADLWLDVSVFERAFALVERIPGDMLTEGQVRVLEEAADLCRGDLLPDWYQDWCIFERERLQNCYLMMLSKLLSCCEAHGLYEKGLAYGQRILSYDRAHERTHQLLMRMHYKAGDRTSALREYQRCVEALREELDVEPAECTVALLGQIRADRLDGREMVPVEADRTSATSQAVLDSCVRQLREILFRFQHEIQRLERDIEVVEHRQQPS
jgi:DNA-binding SARP family transcriptional activator